MSFLLSHKRGELNLRKACFFLLFVFTTVAGFSQNNMGIGTLNPDPSALLDLTATDKGILIPRLSDTGNVPVPIATGLLIYQTSDNTFYLSLIHI